MNKPVLIGVMLGLVALGGCTAQVIKPAAPDPVLVQLSDAARDVRTSLHRLADAKQYDKRHRLPGENLVAPTIPGMTKSVTMPWHGRLEDAVKRLASMSGYTMEVAGKRPASPILVSLGPDPASVGSLLRNLGLQAGHRADVVVDPQRRSIGVVYLDTGL